MYRIPNKVPIECLWCVCPWVHVPMCLHLRMYSILCMCTCGYVCVPVLFLYYDSQIIYALACSCCQLASQATRVHLSVLKVLWHLIWLLGQVSEGPLIAIMKSTVSEHQCFQSIINSFRNHILMFSFIFRLRPWQHLIYPSLINIMAAEPPHEYSGTSGLTLYFYCFTGQI